MKDPYQILGIQANASDEEVKRAYRDLARKYHPDSYQNNPLADLAEEKMKEINDAYDQITKMREGGYSAQQAAGGYYTQNQSSGASNPTYNRIRAFINAGDLAGAERLLDEIPFHDAQWYFLRGSVAYRRGWMDEAKQNFTVAYQKEPNNPEYIQALSMMQRGAQNVYRNGYISSIDGMDCCTTLMCLNCLCGGGRC